MKTSITAVLSLAALLGLAAGSAVASENWTKPQQEVADVIQVFAKANVSGNLDQMMSCTDPGFTAWDFSKPAHQDRAAYRKTESEFYQNWTVLDCALTPTVIQLDRDTAIVHGRHLIPVQSMKGAKRTLEGSWTAALVRRDNQWRMLSLSWVDDRPKVDEAAIKQGVIQMLHGMLAAEERLDADAVWSVHADVPGYWWTDTDGKLYDFAGTKKSWADFYVPCAKLKFTTRQEEVLVLGPDLAFYLWHGAADSTGKDGTVSRVDPWTARYLCRRIGGVWKIVGGQESSLPAQSVAPAASPGPAVTAGEARAALEAYVVDFWTKRDTTALARALSPKMIYHYNGEIIPGAPEDHLKNLREFGGAFPDLVGTVDQFTFADGISAAVTTWTGTHRGELAGLDATGNKPIPATGRKLSWPVNYVFRVEAGKIVELWECWDEANVYLKLATPEAKPAR